MKETINFKDPITFEGAEYIELSFDFDGLTGHDLLSAEKEARAMGDKTAVPELSKQYLATVAARAAKVPVEMIMGLPAKYFTQITLKVQGFFVPED